MKRQRSKITQNQSNRTVNFHFGGWFGNQSAKKVKLLLSVMLISLLQVSPAFGAGERFLGVA